MSKAKSTKTNWLMVEAQHSAGAAVIGEGHDLSVFRARSVDLDLRKADALCRLYPTDILQELRTKISRGALNEAVQILATSTKLHPETLVDPEWQLERTRLSAFANDWSSTIETAGKVLALQPSAPTRMTALQTRALAFFEISNWDLALHDIDQIRSLATLFPAIQAVFYAEILTVRLLASRGDIDRADRLLGSLWIQEAKKPNMNLDRVLTFFRAEAHLARLAKRPSRGFAMASLVAAELLGDEQYAALARLEVACGGDFSKALNVEVQKDRDKYPRIEKLFREIKDERMSASAQSLSTEPVVDDGVPFYKDRLAKVQTLIFPRRKILISLDPFRCRVFAKVTQPLTALMHLAREADGLKKTDLFRILFGDQKYVSHLHDPALHQTLSRVRKNLGAEIEIADGFVRAKGTLVVGGQP